MALACRKTCSGMIAGAGQAEGKECSISFSPLSSELFCPYINLD